MLFASSTVVSLLSSQIGQEDTLRAARLLLLNYCIMMSASETCSLFEGGSNSTRYNILLFVVSMAGCITLGIATVRESGFDQGAHYMIGSFLLSLLFELKIITLLVPKNKLEV